MFAGQKCIKFKLDQEEGVQLEVWLLIVLGITKYWSFTIIDLLFERFLNPERVSMPDIDIDFQDDRRDEVIRYVIDKYGKDHAAQIVTFNTYGPRVANWRKWEGHGCFLCLV